MKDILNKDSIERIEGTIKSKDNLSIFWRAWKPINDIKGTIVIVHGMIEHSENYDYLIENFIQLGFVVYAIDNRGFGRSEGRRAYVNKFSNYVDDFSIFFEKIIIPNINNKPIFLWGHSMGSIILLNYLKNDSDKYTGLILSGTGSDFRIIAKLGILFAQFIGLFSKKIAIKVPLLTKLICNDADIVTKIYYDKYSTKKVSIGINIELYNGVKSAYNNLKNIKLPVLILCGRQDILFSKRERLLEEMPSTDKTLKIFSHFRHEIFKEKESDRNKVINFMIGWIKKHIN